MGMFTVDDAIAEAIRRAWHEGGELAGVLEFQRHFPLISDHAKARECVRIIAGWKPLQPAREAAARIGGQHAPTDARARSATTGPDPSGGPPARRRTAR